MKKILLYIYYKITCRSKLTWVAMTVRTDAICNYNTAIRDAVVIAKRGREGYLRLPIERLAPTLCLPRDPLGID